MYQVAAGLCVSEKLLRLLLYYLPHFKAVSLGLLWLFTGKQIARLKGLTSINRFFFLCPPKQCHSYHLYRMQEEPNYYCLWYLSFSQLLLWQGTTVFQHTIGDLKMLIQAKAYDGRFLTSFFIKASETELGLTSILPVLYIKDYYTSLLWQRLQGEKEMARY